MTTAIVIAEPDRQLELLLTAAGLRSRFVREDAVTGGSPALEVPDLYVVDLRGRPGVPPWLAALRRQHTATPILVLLSALASEVILDAMRAGVNECLAEPLNGPDVHSAIGRLTTRRTATVGSVYAFVGAKGGVGTTTTAVNVATALRDLPGTCLVVDLHLTHGDAALYLGAEPRFSIMDAVENIQRLDATAFDSLVTKTKGGPDLLASSDRSVLGAASAGSLRTLIDLAASRYRYVVLDVPRSDPSALDSLDLATHVILVANQELATVRSASRIAEALRGRYGKQRVSVIITRYDSGAAIGQDDVERVTGAKVMATVPNDYRLALEALNAGRPIMVDNHSSLAGSYRRLACLVAGTEEDAKAREGTSGLLNRLLGRRS